MVAKHPNPKMASAGEVRRAIRALSVPDRLRLRQVARLRVAGLGSLTWEDLLQEAFTRGLAGGRSWPKDVPFIAFLIQTMRSIANEHWRRVAADPVGWQAPPMPTDYVDRATESLANTVDPERETIAERTLQDVENLFQDDTEAQAVLRGLALGLTPEEVVVDTKMTRTQYSSAQRRIRRRLEQYTDAKEK
jgi:DNA-directed RNA polymerase specialized sigma24 family protein